ncbi:hypothetical protein Pfo_016985 [Paulownia fortunei]|nr:hypothetical protein Pfo_016985 [Paulownia fortunei]
MGKKKAVKKTKELSVAIAESSPTEQQTPRKRGRPRKITEKNEVIQEEKPAKKFQDSGESDSQKGKTNKGEEEEEEDKEKKLEEITEEVEGSSSKSKKEEEKSEDKELQKEQHPPRSRARRKSKPRKSS